MLEPLVTLYADLAKIAMTIFIVCPILATLRIIVSIAAAFLEHRDW
jgi:hypothetical protein